MTTRVYVETKTLPPTVLAALADIGFNRPTIAIEPRETDSFSTGAYGDGYQGFTVLVDIDTGRAESFNGSWGGANPFNPGNAVDRDDKQRPVPANACIIHGQRGGGKPVSADIVIHPSRAAKYLPAPSADMPDRLKAIMSVYRYYNSRGRAEAFGRIGIPSGDETSELQRLGYIKVTRAGAVSVTAAGRNVAPDDSWFYRYENALRKERAEARANATTVG